MDDRIVSKELLNGEVDNTLRPQYIKDYVGQEEVKENIKIFILLKEILEAINLLKMP